MKTLQIELPDQLAKEVEDLVHGGWFVDEAELARQALRELVQRQRLELAEQFQREDIRWAMKLG